MASKIKIFVSYAHRDELLLKKLKMHLKPLSRQGLIDLWYDRNISAGAEWEREIDKHLENAQIILLLISPELERSILEQRMPRSLAYVLQVRQSVRQAPHYDTSMELPINLPIQDPPF